MTTIVYRDGVLAVDSLGVLGDWIFGPEVEKIARVEGPEGAFLMAVSGVIAARDRVIEFIKRGAPRDDLPEMSEATALIVPCDGKGGRAWVLGENGCYTTPTKPYLAFGSGTPVALGALHHGATAEEAVAAAIAHDTCSGGRVISMRIAKMASNDDAIPLHKKLAMGGNPNAGSGSAPKPAAKGSKAKGKSKGK